MRYGAINSKDLFGQENPGGIMSATYGLAMLALKSGAPVEQRIEALDRLYDRLGVDPREAALKQPDRSAALKHLADKAKINLTITPGIVEGFSQMLEELVRRKQAQLGSEIEQRRSAIKDLNRFTAESVVGRLLEADDDLLNFLDRVTWRPVPQVDHPPTEDGYYIWFPGEPGERDFYPFFEGGWPDLASALDFYHAEVGSPTAEIVQIKDGMMSDPIDPNTEVDDSANLS